MLVFIFLMSLVVSASAGSEMGVIVDAVEEVNSLREQNVEAVSTKVNKQIFKAACGPVGKRAKELAKAKNLIFRQVSQKNRNPKNRVDQLEKKASRRFKKDRSLKAFWLNVDGVDHYFRRITVRKQCLSCHGAKSERPDFVKKKYPKDHAFGFKIGGLRGLYHVYKKKP